MSEFNTIDELNNEINAKHNHLKKLEELMDMTFGGGIDDFASCLSYASELNYYYSIIDELKELEYKRLDLFWSALGIDTSYEIKEFTEEERQDGVLCGSIPIMSAPIEKRILREYHKRNNGIPGHTMGAKDCPDCKMELGLHAYHCNCCGWHDDDKQKEMFDHWNGIRKKRRISEEDMPPPLPWREGDPHEI